jgi:hypothetical protein
MSNQTKVLDPKVWGPHYWFFLHTITMFYPLHPNTVTKKKYYDFIQNIPLFLPIETIATDFSKLLDEYPVTPYLDSRDSLIRWMHFIHNKINQRLEKPSLTLHEFYKVYYESYKPREKKYREWYKMMQKLLFIVMIAFILYMSYYFYNC